MKKLIAGTLIVVLLLVLCPAAGALETKYIYQAVVTNHSLQSAAFSFSNDSRQKAVLFDFERGRVVLKSYYSSVFSNTEGKEVYVSVPDGEAFLLSCVLETATGRVSIAINGEPVGYAIYGMYRDINPKPVWYKNDGNNVLASGAEFTITDEEKFYAEERVRTVQVISCDTAGVTLDFSPPVPYRELEKIEVTDEEGRTLKIADYQKKLGRVSFRLDSPLPKQMQYHIKAREIMDIYDGVFSFDETFIPETEGTPAQGYNVAYSGETADAMEFEEAKAWRTEADILADNPDLTEKDLSITYYGGDFEAQSHGAKPDDVHKSQGNFSIRWDNHPFYSTLSTTKVPKDWTGANMFKIWIYAGSATNETVMLTIYSDNEKTPWRDGYIYPIKIDWSGAREFSIPLQDFYRFNEPTDFHNVGGIYFYTKMFEQQPNPETVLHLDNIRIEYDENYPITPNPGYREAALSNHRGVMFNPNTLNHEYDEVQSEAEINAEKEEFIHYGAYFKTERAQYGYFPRYAPSLPSFDHEGNAYILKNMTIQALRADETWHTVDLEPYFLEAFPQHGLNYLVYDQGFSDESTIRFDSVGGVYVGVTVYAQAYLFYSPDGMKSWQVYYLRGETGLTSGTSFLRFERIEGNNREAADRPPAFLLASGENGPCHLIVTKKKADGTLAFTAVTYAENAITPAAHSGDGNALISVGNSIYVVYGKTADLTEQERNALPLQDSAPNRLSWEKSGQIYYSKNGTPAFIRRYDVAGKTLSEPVFIGYGGHQADDHNWPNVTVDSSKRLHIIVNGHHDPIYYSHTINPEDISAWSEPTLIGGYDSYASMLTDADDTIYLVTRDSRRGYRFDLSLYKKTAGSSEFRQSYLVQRLEPYYEVWRNRMTLNPITGALYINYRSQSSSVQLFKDEYDAFLYTWPELERRFLKTGAPPKGTAHTDEGRYVPYNTMDSDSGREGVVLISNDGGASFRLAKTSDFKANQGNLAEIVSLSVSEDSVTVKSAGLSEDALSAYVFLAFYEGEQLVGTKSEMIELRAGAEQSARFPRQKATKVRAFLWSSDLMPLCIPVSMRLNSVETGKVNKIYDFL